ncbi:T6SS phospholipase effector Tle1-like catalytic domain-containing protein [Pseudoduganella aquatica]|uniref:T6SS Phospholipase effector Tle1-like catalytic domain-containing protein n=1 Tax=Pseudoduganella aquatica TaxID=2660641 RepID=A0A7X4HHP6_9BURK|nr:DUF2235 domain-containing protein [Pseudoduganella aquatica]MYN11463.1 hypothetical protein [Pseudoduganella aquatica]
MKTELTTLVQPGEKAQVDQVCKVDFNSAPDQSKCEVCIQVGFFFDGTNNNRNIAAPALAHSNIARLAAAYPDQPNRGSYDIYIPGVGTAFPEIGETGPSTMGTAFASGCESRVLFALLAVLNALHRAVFSQALFISMAETERLCHELKSRENVDTDKHGAASETNFMHGDFLRTQVVALQKKLAAQKKPVIKECMIDVFGFSRGAAEARVFCNWLDRLLAGGTLSGVPLTIRFLGIFDTVASAGIADGVLRGATNITDGHEGWAAMEYLSVPGSVKNCVHMLAMHELRKNFPLDEIGLNGVMQPKHIQVAYPGAHSDVGGGYAPSELGISVGATTAEGDALKLSQIPLNHMFQYAVAAGVPLSRKLALEGKTGYDPFAVSPVLTKAFNDFLSESGLQKRPLRDWMQVYLNWRWQVRDVYRDCAHVRRASASDAALLTRCNRKLKEDAALLLGSGNVRQAQRHVDSVNNGTRKNMYDQLYAQQAIDIPYFDDEAAKVLDDARRAAPVSQTIASFFDSFVHDSFAGFSKDLLEATGYWRYRKAFKGTTKVLFAATNESTDTAA